MQRCQKVGYVRVSKEEQNPDNQRKQLLDAGVIEDCIFIDKGISGTIPAHQRPAFKAMLEYIRDPDHDVKYLYVYEISRLGRTTLETINVINEIESMGVMVWSLSPAEAFTRNEDKAIRQLLVMILSWVAQRERDNLVERTKAGLDRARASGKRLGRPRIDIDADQVMQMREAGEQWKDIADKMGVPVMTLYRYRKRKGFD
jgi:putative DNA-invertase from lambdoid prophage Rac